MILILENPQIAAFYQGKKDPTSTNGIFVFRVNNRWISLLSSGTSNHGPMHATGALKWLLLVKDNEVEIPRLIASPLW